MLSRLRPHNSPPPSGWNAEINVCRLLIFVYFFVGSVGAFDMSSCYSAVLCNLKSRSAKYWWFLRHANKLSYHASFK